MLFRGSLFGLTYSALYALCGGIEDTGWLYAAAVGALGLFSAATPLIWVISWVRASLPTHQRH